MFTRAQDKAPKHITLIGMSNMGKSHWSKKLAEEKGCERIDCDTLIEAKLEPELKARGFSGLADVAKWMGQPYDPQYAENSKKYLQFETEVMQEVIQRMQTSTKPLVIDTTGSVIYTGEEIAKALRKHSTVAYFKASPEHINKLFESYKANPKPVIWDGNFQRDPDESNEMALERCYKDKLLPSRAVRYDRMAKDHVTIDYDTLRAPDMDIDKFLGLVDAGRKRS